MALRSVAFKELFNKSGDLSNLYVLLVKTKLAQGNCIFSLYIQNQGKVFFFFCLQVITASISLNMH